MARTLTTPAATAMARRLDRGALLRGTALQAAVALVFVAPVIVSPAAAQPAPNARPQGGQVVAGSASIAQAPTSTTVTQSSNRAAVDWRSFDVGANQSVTFRQPGPTSVTLNRVTGPDPSAIAGRISANGQLILTNPSGVTFYQGAQVNAQSVIVSAAGIGNRNFMAGRMVFDRDAKPGARIDNAGTITVRQAGLAALVAPSVANSGTINARMGHVVLGGGAVAHTLDMYGDGLVSIDVTKSVVRAPLGPNGQMVTALVTNTGVIAADGGTVQLTARAADGVVQDLVRAGGTIRANTAAGRTGQIEIVGTGGSVVVEGRVLAEGRTPGSTGGTVVVAGSTATVLAPTARVSADGHAGGGLVALGTTAARARGTGTAPPGTSARTVLAAGSRVSADATAAGDGGRITVLSTETTAVGGAISARGGRVSGSGGTIELSGETGFRLTGTANTSAPHGAPGTIVLDPRDLTITATPNGTTNVAPTNGTDPNIAYNTPSTVADAFVTPAQLQALTGNLHLQATRDLTVASSFTYTGGANVVLEAGRNLTVNTGVTISVPLFAVQSAFVPSILTLTAATAAIPGFDPAGTLTVAGNLSAAGLQLNAGTGGIVLSGQLTTQLGSFISRVGLTTAGPVSQTVGRVATNDLSGTAGSVSLLSTSNAISGIGTAGAALTSTAGGITVVNSLFLAVGTNGGGGPNGIAVPAGQNVTLQAYALGLQAAAGSFAVNAPGGTVTLSPLTPGTGIQVTASPTVQGNTAVYRPADLARVNASTLRLANTGAGGISFGQAGFDTQIDLTRFPTIALSSQGAVTQTAPLLANTLSGTMAGLTLLDAGNAIRGLAAVNSTSDVAVTTAGNLAVSGGLSANGVLDVRAGGTLTISGFVNNQGGNTLATAGADLVTNPGAHIGANGNVLLTAGPAGTLTLNGNASVPESIRLTAGTGGIAFGAGRTGAANVLTLSTPGPVTQTTGVVRVDGLNGTVGSLSLPSRANVINSLAATATAATGDILVVSANALFIGRLGVQPGRTITLVSDGLTVGVGPNGNGSINAPGGTLVVAPYTAGGAVLLTSGPKPATGLSLTTTELGQVQATTLQLGGGAGTPNVPQAGVITVGQPGDTAIDLGVPNIRRLVFQGTGAVTQTTALGVATVSGAAASLTLANPGNFISTLDGFTAPGGVSLHTSSGLAVTADVVASFGPIQLSGSAPVAGRTDNASIALAASLTAPSVDLNGLTGNPSVAGGIAQDAGILTTTALAATADFVRLTQPNQVIQLTGVTATSDITITDARPLFIAQNTVATTNGPVTLNTQGITQAPGTSVVTRELDGSSTAATVLDSRTNQVSGIGTFTQVAGDLTLVTASPTLTFGLKTGVVSAPQDSLRFVTDGAALSPNAVPSTAVTASGLVSFAPFTPGRRTEVIGATAADANSLSLPQRLLSRITAARLALGDATTAGPINIGNPGEAIDLSATAPTLQLLTTGAVTQGVNPGGPTAGGTLSLRVGNVVGSAASLALDAAANRIDQVGAPDGFPGGTTGLAATNGALAVLDSVPLSMPAGAQVTATGALRLSTSGGDLSLAGTVATPGTLTLAASSGAVTQTGGTIAAGTLTGSGNAVSLPSAGNAVAALGTLTTGGAFTLTDSTGLMVAGPVGASTVSLSVAGPLVLSGTLQGTAGVTLAATGDITQPGGSIVKIGRAHV